MQLLELAPVVVVQQLQLCGLAHCPDEESERPAGPYFFGQMSDDVAGLMRSLGFAGAHVSSYSIGGQIAVQVASDHPELVDRLILTATSARPPITRRFSQAWLMVDIIARIPCCLWSRANPPLRAKLQVE